MEECDFQGITVSQKQRSTGVKHCAGKVTSHQRPSMPSKLELVDPRKNKGWECRDEQAEQLELLCSGQGMKGFFSSEVLLSGRKKNTCTLCKIISSFH
uniref:Uncharacterized protein n=1 Tax=Anguilla anguilla TaxID=7936 RepID=A0A0E9WTL3_ANGAN